MSKTHFPNMKKIVFKYTYSKKIKPTQNLKNGQPFKYINNHIYFQKYFKFSNNFPFRLYLSWGGF